MRKIYLASKSPRRKEIISNAGFEFELVSIDVEEDFPEDMPLEGVAEYLANKKADACLELPRDGILLTSDTIVIIGNEILNKPENKEEARQMLEKLSGRTHLVITGVCLRDKAKSISLSDVSKVTFAELSFDEIEDYINTPSPYDKAGAYGIQDGLGMLAVKSIEGSYFNIMGLPIHRVYEELNKW
jgi:septum formation protein